MTYGALTPQDFACSGRARPDKKLLSDTILCGAALVLSASVGLWMLYAHQGTRPEVGSAPATPVATVDVSPATVPAAIVSLRRYGALLDPGFTGGHMPVTFAQSAPLRSGFEPLRQTAARNLMPPSIPDLRLGVAPTPMVEASVPAANMATAPKTGAATSPVVPPAPIVATLESDVPLPAPRPRSGLTEMERPAPSAPDDRRRVVQQPDTPASAAAPANQPSFFDKLFGRAQNPGSALAYAAPEDNGIGAAVPGLSTQTAVYEIATHTVHMPNGMKLEAHSGLGAYRDDPRSVTVRMRGATPPNVYDLALRESLFHGVQALRLTPVGGTTFGRGGLLAHTYMLGPHGDSNGCVVFKDYKAFLAAYTSGQVRRLVVVDRLN